MQHLFPPHPHFKKCLLGRGGARIRQMQERSGATIKAR